MHAAFSEAKEHGAKTPRQMRAFLQEHHGNEMFIPSPQAISSRYSYERHRASGISGGKKPSSKPDGAHASDDPDTAAQTIACPRLHHSSYVTPTMPTMTTATALMTDTDDSNTDAWRNLFPITTYYDEDDISPFHTEPI
jgi:hypothetical protein